MVIFMKKIPVFLAFVFIILSAFPEIPASGVTFTPNFTVSSESAILINLDKDITVYEKNPTKKMYPASLTKIMTAMVVLDNVKDLDNTQIEAPLAVFDDLYGKGASSVGLSRGEITTAADLMYSMLLCSACESAGTLAYHVGGQSMPNFVDMMNKKATEIGCTGTNFVNPHGLFDENQYTNARDMAVIFKYAVKNYPKLVDIANTPEYAMKATNYQEAGWRTIKHTNSMVNAASEFYYPYVKGFKTGTLDESGRCLATLGSRDGNNYMLITLGAPMYDGEGNDVYGHYEDHKNIYEWAFNTFAYQKLIGETQEITEVPVKMGRDENHVILVPDGEFYALWPNTLDMSAIKYDIDVQGYLDADGAITAPVAAGKKMGEVTLSISGEVLCVLNLVSKSGVELNQLDYNIMKAREFLGSFWFKAAVGIAAAAIILYIVIYINVTKKRRKKMKRLNKKRKF